MGIAETDFMKINSILSKYYASEPLTKNHNIKKSILPSIEKETNLSQEVERLYKDRDISEFTYSLFKAFINNYSKENRIDNVVHMRYLRSSSSYQFALNNGFYCLKAPQMDKQDWTGDIYAYQKQKNNH